MEFRSHVCFQLGISDVPLVDMLSLFTTPSQLPISQRIPFGVGWHNTEDGATAIPIMVVFTDQSGRIASELVDAPISQGSRGPKVVASVHGVIEKVRCMSKKLFSDQ